MRPAQEGLLSLVERIFEDGVVSASERSELVSLYRGAGLTVPEVKEVFAAFLKRTWGETIADGVLTNEERAKLATIVRELRIPAESVPTAASAAIRAA